MRLDVYLKEQGLAPSRSRAQMLIDDGCVRVDGKTVRRAAEEVADGQTVTVENALRYVSRGGLKLEAALSAFAVSCAGRVVLDVGASSGGFTDCVLQNGAALVYAVDSGSGQLAPCLRQDQRVVCRENYNARYMRPADFEKTPTFAVMDVSFISQTLIHPALAAVLPAGSPFITLIKPQFEAGRAAVGRGGIVRRPAAWEAAVERVRASAEACGFACRGVMDSPIPGGDGNHEFLAYFIKTTGEEAQ